jgi:hypothetical protein
MVAAAGLLVSAVLAVAAPLSAQTTGQAPEMRFIHGQVMLGRREAPLPVRGAWVVVHRIASDPSGRVSGGPLDSARTTATGDFEIRYPYTGDSATYIALTNYEGISYISAPLTLPRVTGDDAAIMVFDTTSPPYPIRVAGRHFVLSNPLPNGDRRIIEVLELMNDSTMTVIGSAANPVFRAMLPPDAAEFQMNPMGDISPDNVARTANGVDVFAPISPGMRQLSFTYTLPPRAFPLSVPLLDSGEVLEVLVQEPGAIINGAGLTETAPIFQEGQNYRRLLSTSVGTNAVLQIQVPRVTSAVVRKAVMAVAAVFGVALLAVLAFIALRGRRRPVVRRVSAAPEDDVDRLVRELALLDSEFERQTSPADEGREQFEARRASLKAELTAALAARDRPA